MAPRRLIDPTTTPCNKHHQRTAGVLTLADDSAGALGGFAFVRQPVTCGEQSIGVLIGSLSNPSVFYDPEPAEQRGNANRDGGPNRGWLKEETRKGFPLVDKENAQYAVVNRANRGKSSAAYHHGHNIHRVPTV
jgi:hypothetical protein